MYLHLKISTMYLLCSCCIVNHFWCYRGVIQVRLGTGVVVWIGLRDGSAV